MSAPPLLLLQQCYVCRKGPAKVCARCRDRAYCSKACQKQHWENGHKEECRPKDVATEAMGTFATTLIAWFTTFPAAQTRLRGFEGVVFLVPDWKAAGFEYIADSETLEAFPREWIRVNRKGLHPGEKIIVIRGFDSEWHCWQIRLPAEADV